MENIFENKIDITDKIHFKETIGTVIATSRSPSTQRIDFVLKSEEIIVVRGEILEIPIETQNILVLGVIQEIQKTNAYFSSADVTKDMALPTSTSNRLGALFPTDEWASTLVTLRPLGFLSSTSDKVQRVQFPVSPGSLVHRSRPEVIQSFLGLVDAKQGIHLGTIATGQTPLIIDITKLLRKHLAILAISGAGKSYATSVLLEELFIRSTEMGRLPVLIIDPHGEYSNFADILDQPSLVSVYPGRYFSIQTNKLSAYRIREYAPDMSSVQIRELDKIIQKLRKVQPVYSFRDLIDMVSKADDKIGLRTKESLLGWLDGLERTSLFGTNSYPDIKKLITPGKISVFDLSDIQSIRNKQIIAAYIARTAFDLRRKNKVSPFLLIVEEAHGFVPENGIAISKGIIETIAREGRKFFASLCLISQRPVRLSSTALSQCNTHLIMRIRNPYDLDYLGRLSEGIDKDTLRFIPDLDVGEGILVGEAVNYPILFRVRKKKFTTSKFENSITDELQKFEEKS